MNKLKKKYRDIVRIPINIKNRKRWENKDFTIIASNCIGGVIYHELGLEFRSPTINMYIKSSDFVKLCSNLKKYMKYEPEQVNQTEYNFPVMKISDITLYCVHYKTFEEAKEKWNQRKKRINYDNIYFIMSERDGCTEEDLKKFDMINNKHKVVFVHKNMDNIKSSYYIKGTENTGEDKDIHKIIGLTAYKGKWTGKRYIDDFDYVSFLNERG